MGETGLTTLSYVNTVIRERPRQIHKGQCGRVLIVAGSVGMAGACVLSTGAALRSGAGLVKAAVPEEDLSDPADRSAAGYLHQCFRPGVLTVGISV